MPPSEYEGALHIGEEKEVTLMSTIRQYAAGNSFYESMYGTSNNTQSNSFLSGLNMNADTGNTFSLSDYAMIKNGTYGKLTKA